MADSVFLGEEQLYLTASPSNPLAKLPSVALSELSSKRFLFADSSNDMQSIQMHYCRLAGFAAGQLISHTWFPVLLFFNLVQRVPPDRPPERPRGTP